MYARSPESVAFDGLPGGREIFGTSKPCKLRHPRTMQVGAVPLDSSNVPPATRASKIVPGIKSPYYAHTVTTYEIEKRLPPAPHAFFVQARHSSSSTVKLRQARRETTNWGGNQVGSHRGDITACYRTSLGYV